MKVFMLMPVLAVALGLWVSGVASAQPQDLNNPPQATAPATYQDLRSPDQVAPARGHIQDLRNPDQIAPKPAIATQPAPPAQRAVASDDVIPTPDGGLSTLLIVLIACGGAAALAGAAYGTMRVVHAHANVPT